jgi:transposase
MLFTPTDALLADKACETHAIRGDLKERRIKPVIPRNQAVQQMIRHSKRLYRERNCVERVLGHLKITPGIAAGYIHPADSFLGMPFLATTLLDQI